MKSISFIGILLLIVSALLFYLSTDFAVEDLRLSHIIGILFGIGIGLILGGMVGYVSKGNALKQEQKRREFKELQKEKELLAKKAAELEKKQSEAEVVHKPLTDNTNPQNY